MRIAISDYDGTMYHAGQLIGDFLPQLHSWREGGDKFGIATGRDFSMTISEIQRWNIPVDFLVCVNGAAIYDAGFSMIRRRFIDNEQIPVILQHPAAQASMHWSLSGAGPQRIALTERSWFPQHGIDYTEVTAEQALLARDLGQISFAYDTEEECVEWELMLREDLDDVIVPHRNKTTLDITAPGVDKATGIQLLLEAMKWRGNRVYVIGDGGNDVAMIERFDGSTVPGASEEVRKIARKTYPDIGAMLDDVMRNPASSGRF